MKTESKKRVLFLLSCMLVQSKGEVPCKMGFKGIENLLQKDEITDESCDAGSLCARFEVESLESWNNQDGM